MWWIHSLVYYMRGNRGGIGVCRILRCSEVAKGEKGVTVRRDKKRERRDRREI